MEGFSLFIAIISVLAAGFSAFYTRGLVKAEYGPKVYVVGELIEDNGWDVALMKGYPHWNNGEGFSELPSNRALKLKVVNNGVAPALDVKVRYNITLYSYYADLEVENGGYMPINKEELNKISKETTIEYLPPGTENSNIIFYCDNYHAASLSVQEVKCSQKNFIKNEVVILHYEHPGFKETRDSSDFRRMLGVEVAP